MTVKIVEILGVPFQNLRAQDMLNNIRQHIERKQKGFIVTANPEIVMYAVQHSDYMETIQSADYIVADGSGVILGSKMLGTPLPERIAGFDLMKDMLAMANQQKLKVFFLGAKEDVIEQAVMNVQKDYPELVVAGYHHGFFKDNDHSIMEKVQQTEPDFIFVALGYPRQEEWIRRNYHHFAHGVFMGVGGSFDILAGRVKRAPLIWRKLNIEWLYRLLIQPSRWRRMLMLPQFVMKVKNSKKLRQKE